MRTLLIAPSFGEFGGIESFMFRLARTLHDEDDSASTTICFKRVTTFQMQETLTRALASVPARVVFVDRASHALVRTIRCADIVHSQNPSIDIALATACLRKPHVMTIHAGRHQRWTARGVADLVAANLADRRLYNSDFVWDSWEPRGRHPTSAKLPILSNLPTGPVDPGERRGFVFVGRWVPNKGLEVLIDAYARAELDPHTWPLTMMGEGPLRPALEGLIKQRGIRGIEVTGYVDDDVRNRRIRMSKWLVAPPHTNEDLGLTPIEARNVGVPCIVTRDGGLLEAAGAFSLSCEPGDVEQLSRLLQFAAALDERSYERLAQETHRELKSYLQPMASYLRLYREMLSVSRTAQTVDMET